MSVLISAIICTHNRSELLPKAIQSLLDQRMPTSQYEIIVIDNCSTDQTREVVNEFSQKKHTVRSEYEPNLGLSHARNAGWRKARGKYVTYLDDDAIASPEWLNIIVKTFETVKPKPGCVGGKVAPIWEAPRPAWVSDELVTCLAVIDWSDKAQILPDLNQKWLVGANIAFPTNVLRKIGGFVSGLDRVGKTLLSGGDVFLQKQIVTVGHTCYYQPKMVVWHFIPKSRLNQIWFIRRYYYQGLSDAAMQLIEQSPSVLGRQWLAAVKILDLLKAPEKILNLIVSSNSPERFREKCYTIIKLGHIVGLLGAIGRIK